MIGNKNVKGTHESSIVCINCIPSKQIKETIRKDTVVSSTNKENPVKSNSNNTTIYNHGIHPFITIQQIQYSI